MSRFRRGFWLYPLFQIPLILFLICVVITVLLAIFSWGRPSVAVAIALDLSSSTYGSVLEQEITAVQAYLQQNQLLNAPNQIQVFGFVDQAIALTPSFSANSQQLENELAQSLHNPVELVTKVGLGRNLSLAIESTTNALSSINRCRELLIVTNGQAEVTPQAIAKALNNKVKINAFVINSQAPALLLATASTGGIYQVGQRQDLPKFFTRLFFNQFNSNRPWLNFGLGCCWIALMWVLVMPLDRWILQSLFGLNMTLAGQLALGNALFWTVATPGILWRLSSLPFLSRC